jgi:O-antigen/teichoic acid export membrane protein
VAAVDEAALGSEGAAGGLGGLARSFSALMAGELANKLLRFAAAAVLARGMAPDDFGLFNVGIAAGGILVTLTTLGLPEVAGRAVAVDAARAAGLARLVAIARVLATLAVGIGALVVLQVAWSGHLLFGGAIVAMAVAMSATADWAGRALERMRTVGAGAASGGVVALIGAGVVAAASGSAAAGLGAFVAAEVAADLVYWTAPRHGGGSRAVPVADLRPLLKRSWPVALSSLAIYSYYANLDTIIMAATRSESEAGVYSAAYRIYLAANIVGIFAAYATFPRVSRLGNAVPIGDLIARLRPTLEPLLAYGVIAVGVAELIGRQLLEVCFGTRFGAAADTFVLLCLSTAWYCVGYPIGYNLIAVERNRRFLLGALVGAGLNLGLDLVLIPQVGMIGAGVATSVSIVGATAAWLGARGMLARVLRPILAVGVASSAGAVAALVWPDTADPIGALTVAAGLAGAGLLAVRHRRAAAA